MKIVFNENGSLSINTWKYIYKAINDFSETVDTNVNSPAAYRLFTVDIKSPKLSAKKVDTFHKVIINQISKLPYQCSAPEYKNLPNRIGENSSV